MGKAFGVLRGVRGLLQICIMQKFKKSESIEEMFTAVRQFFGQPTLDTVESFVNDKNIDSGDIWILVQARDNYDKNTAKYHLPYLNAHLQHRFPLGRFSVLKYMHDCIMENYMLITVL